jgi:hypothetical protein
LTLEKLREIGRRLIIHGEAELLGRLGKGFVLCSVGERFFKFGDDLPGRSLGSTDASPHLED